MQDESKKISVTSHDDLDLAHGQHSTIYMYCVITCDFHGRAEPVGRGESALTRSVCTCDTGAVCLFPGRRGNFGVD